MSIARRFAYAAMKILGVEIDGFPNEGIAAFGYWLRPRRGAAPGPFRGAAALEVCLTLSSQSVLDVGSGGGEQARAFTSAGRAVTCIDFGSSVYAQTAPAEADHKVLHGDFMQMDLAEPRDLVWCCHTLEHQPNVGLFLQKLHAACAPGGWVCITLPVCHRALWGGHLTLWTPGLLAYNLAFSGVDVSQAELIRGHREFSLLYQPRAAERPDLTYDSGDIDRLAALLPPWCREGVDGWRR